MKKVIKVIFFYPNTFGMNMLPSTIAMFSALSIFFKLEI